MTLTNPAVADGIFDKLLINREEYTFRLDNLQYLQVQDMMVFPTSARQHGKPNQIKITKIIFQN